MIKIRRLIRILCVVIFGISAWSLLDMLVLTPIRIKNEVKGVQEIYTYPKNNSEEDQQNENLKKLQEINPEICGWIKIDDTNIDYPVLYKAGDTDYYLSHNYKKENSRYGSITVDARCTDGVKSKNVILHGHHMKDGQMFANLMKFGDVSFCRNHQTIRFDTFEKNGLWKVFAVFKASTLPEQGEVFNYYITKFSNKIDFNKYIKEIRKRSLIDFPIDVKYSDRLLTLSTCSYEKKGFRTIVMARKLRKNESLDANSDQIKAADSPLMP